MERNENGYPTMPRGTVRDDGVNMMRDCRENLDAALGDKPLAYAYVPIQSWRMLYSPSDALAHGTLFEELYKPKEVYGRE